MKIYGMALFSIWDKGRTFPWSKLPLILLMLCIFSVSLDAKLFAKPTLQPAYGKLPSQTQAKLDWLAKHGTPIKYGPTRNYRKIRMCRRTSDGKAILAKRWGLQQEVIYMDMVSCPESW